MPIYLPAPAHNPKGVDGLGWNRMAIHGMCNDQCALKPRQMSAFFDSLDTRKARYGMYGPCVNNGDCSTCDLLYKEVDWSFFTEKMLIRVDEVGRPWLMNRPDNGWEEFSRLTRWEDVLMIKGAIFKRHKDKHSDGVMMIRMAE